MTATPAEHVDDLEDPDFHVEDRPGCEAAGVTTTTLDWPGTYNARDLGGLPTCSGGTTRSGAFVRSESLHLLGPNGWRALHAHGIRTCVDLRSSWEVDATPYDPGSAATRVWAPLEEGLLDDPEFSELATSGVLGTALYYPQYLARWPDRVAEALRQVAAAAPGVLFHCQRGRDRTGLVAILLLALAGVPHEVIVAEHLATDDRLRTAGAALGHVGLDGEAEIYDARGTDAERTLTGLLDGLDVVELLRSGGLGPEEVDALRARLIR